MTEDERKVFERAFAAVDSVDAERQAEPRAESPDEKIEREGAEADALLAGLQRRRLERQPSLSTVDKQPKAQPMTDADRRWILERLGAVAAMIGAEVGKTQSEVAKKLREEIGQLRAEVALLQAYKASKSDVAIEGSVTPMMRGRHVA